MNDAFKLNNTRRLIVVAAVAVLVTLVATKLLSGSSHKGAPDASSVNAPSPANTQRPPTYDWGCPSLIGDKSQMPPGAMYNQLTIGPGSEIQWNGAIIHDLPQLTQYLGVTTAMHPRPYLVIDVQPNASASTVASVRADILMDNMCH